MASGRIPLAKCYHILYPNFSKQIPICIVPLIMPFAIFIGVATVVVKGYMLSIYRGGGWGFSIT